jgi:hypothetical protein
MHVAHVEAGVGRHRNTRDFRPSWSPGLIEPETVALVVQVGTESEIEGWCAGECRGRAAELFVREDH